MKSETECAHVYCLFACICEETDLRAEPPPPQLYIVASPRPRVLLSPHAARITKISYFLPSTTACDSGVFLGMHQWRVYMSAFCCFSLSILWQGLVYFAAPLVKKQWLLEGVSRHSLNKWAYMEWAMGPGPLRQMWLRHFNSPSPPPPPLPRTYVDAQTHVTNIYTISKIVNWYSIARQVRWYWTIPCRPPKLRLRYGHG